jgi:hypothetical protein
MDCRRVLSEDAVVEAFTYGNAGGNPVVGTAHPSDPFNAVSRSHSSCSNALVSHNRVRGGSFRKPNQLRGHNDQVKQGDG